MQIFVFFLCSTKAMIHDAYTKALLRPKHLKCLELTNIKTKISK